MKILLEHGKIEEKESEIIILGLFEGQIDLSGPTRDIDIVLGGSLSSLVKRGDFTGKVNEILPFYAPNNIKAKRLLFVGLGKKQDFSFEVVRNISGRSAKYIRGMNIPKYMTLVHGEDSGLPVSDLIQALVEGSNLALYTFTQYKTEVDYLPKQIEEMTIFLDNRDLIPSAEKSLVVAQAAIEAVKLARDIANTPSNHMNPTTIAEIAKKMANTFSLKCTVIDKSDMEQLRMGGLLAVSVGSLQPPKMVILEYYGKPKNDPPIVLIGKGITFDSGGISIKPSEKMEDMKYDKSGAATVIAVMQAIAKLRIPLNVVSIAPLAENVPSGSAYKPGDVIKHFGGKTSEIINTDAEGRIILADALAYAINYKPKAIIDFATLTGACTIALGTHASGLFSNNHELRRKIIEAGEMTGERVWELPLWKEYFEQIKSEIADIKNTGGRAGGAITAAAFLNQFVKEYPWAHVDIAGTAYTQEGTGEKTYIPKGATGVGVRLLIHFLQNWSELS